MITLICGHSRAGKTTYSQRFDNVLHLDEIHTTQRVIQLVKAKDGDVVVEGIYYRPSERESLLHAYKGQGSRCICLDTPKEVREERMGHLIKHDYPFRYPTLDEGWDELIIIRGDNDVQCYRRQIED